MWIDDNFDLNIERRILCRHLFNVFRFNFKCGLEVNRFSNIIPRYFTWDVVEISKQT